MVDLVNIEQEVSKLIDISNRLAYHPSLDSTLIEAFINTIIERNWFKQNDAPYSLRNI